MRVDCFHVCLDCIFSGVLRVCVHVIGVAVIIVKGGLFFVSGVYVLLGEVV